MFSFFFCLPKRRNKKKAPQPIPALRASLASRRGRDAKKLGLRPQTVLASFSALICEARQDKWGGKRGNPIGTQPSTGEAAEKGFALFEAKPSLQSPGSIEEHPMRGINSGHPAFGGTRDTGCPFFGSFLWPRKEMNRTTSFSIPQHSRLNHKKRLPKRLPFAEINWRQNITRRQIPSAPEPFPYKTGGSPD